MVKRLFTIGVVALLCLAGAQLVAAAAPANDNFAFATVLAAGGGTLATSNVGATLEAGEPLHAGNAGGASIWFSWTPNFTGTASIDTAGSDFDTLLDAYTGSTVSSLTPVGSNDDIGGLGGTSRTCFAVTSGTTYHFSVDGYDGVTGSVDLTWGAKSDSNPCPTLPASVTGLRAVGHLLTAMTG